MLSFCLCTCFLLYREKIDVLSAPIIAPGIIVMIDEIGNVIRKYGIVFAIRSVINV